MNRWHKEECYLTPTNLSLQIRGSEDGELIAALPLGCTDAHAWDLLEYMNRAFDRGRVCGRQEKAREILTALQEGRDSE